MRLQIRFLAREGFESEEIAEDAVRLIKVEYEPLPVLATVEQAMSANAPPVT